MGRTVQPLSLSEVQMSHKSGSGTLSAVSEIPVQIHY